MAQHNSIEAIIRTIIAQCTERGVTVTEPLSAFIIKAVLLEQSTSFQLDKNLTPDDVEQLVTVCVERLLQTDSPALETIKMQVAFHTASVEEQRKLDMKYEETEQTLESIFSSLPVGRIPENFTETYQTVFTYVLERVRFKEDHSLSPQIHREAHSALESILPTSELPSLLRLPAKDLRPQLDELTDIVLGIRLYNKANGLGSEDLVNYNEFTLPACMELLSTLTLHQERIRRYIRACELEVRRPDAAAEQGDRLYAELSNRRQLLSYFGTLVEEIEEIHSVVAPATQTFEADMADLKKLVGQRTAVPKGQVYPKFVSLAQVWRTLADAHDAVLARDATASALTQYVDSIQLTLAPDRIDAILADDDLQHTPPPPPPPPPALQIADGAALIPRGEPGFTELPLHLKGFCPYTLVHRGGLLLPGDPALGLVRYQELYLACRDHDALSAVLADPQRYIDQILATARHSPELIHLLDLQERFPDAAMPARAPSLFAKRGSPRAQESVPVAVDEKDCQTPTHFVTRNIDYSYDWNEWSLRRKALQLVHLKNKRTHSTQSNLSHFRREAATQHYPPKHASTNTGIHTGQTPANVVTYMRGLRGRPTQKMNITTLQIDERSWGHVVPVRGRKIER